MMSLVGNMAHEPRMAREIDNLSEMVIRAESRAAAEQEYADEPCEGCGSTTNMCASDCPKFAEEHGIWQ